MRNISFLLLLMLTTCVLTENASCGTKKKNVTKKKKRPSQKRGHTKNKAGKKKISIDTDDVSYISEETDSSLSASEEAVNITPPQGATSPTPIASNILMKKESEGESEEEESPPKMPNVIIGEAMQFVEEERKTKEGELKRKYEEERKFIRASMDHVSKKAHMAYKKKLKELDQQEKEAQKEIHREYDDGVKTLQVLLEQTEKEKREMQRKK